MWGWPVMAAESTNRQLETHYKDNFLIASSSTYIPRIEGLGSCVVFARNYTGRQIFGNANTLRPTHYDPHVGDWVLFSNHVSVIVDIRGQTLYLWESNYIPCKASQRTIQVDDPTIKGYL